MQRDDGSIQHRLWRTRGAAFSRNETRGARADFCATGSGMPFAYLFRCGSNKVVTAVTESVRITENYVNE